MVEVRKYNLPPTALIPNSPHPLLHYVGLLNDDGESRSPAHVYDLFKSNGWRVQWIFRYGETQRSHYHSQAHECMAVLSGNATIRFGVADTVDDMQENTYGSGAEPGGVELHAQAGDVFVLPAGTAHKTYSTQPQAEFALLTPGNGHHVAPKAAAEEGDGDGIRQTLADIELSGFTMIGSYPVKSGEWDFAVGGESDGQYEKVWAVPVPENDPVLGKAAEGVTGQWHS